MKDQIVARCDYYGLSPPARKHEGQFDCKRGEKCLCERPSSESLPFFRRRADKPHDTFFCGCWGWD